jgi:hypothetical protein
MRSSLTGLSISWQCVEFQSMHWTLTFALSYLIIFMNAIMESTRDESGSLGKIAILIPVFHNL